MHIVFLPREFPEFARKYRHGDQPLEFFLVIDILIVLFDPEYRRPAWGETGPEEIMPAVSRERHSAAVVPAGNDAPILILEIRFGTVIDHVDRIVVKHFELWVEFIDMIPCDRSGRQHFVPGPAKQGQRQSGSARERIADLVRLVEQQADLVGSPLHKGP